jgi:hypothetical protein
MTDFSRNAVEDVEQAVENRHGVLSEEKSFLANHPALAAQAQDRRLIIEIAGAPIPSVMDFAMARQRYVEADNAGGLSLLDPGYQLVAPADWPPRLTI